MTTATKLDARQVSIQTGVKTPELGTKFSVMFDQSPEGLQCMQALMRMWKHDVDYPGTVHAMLSSAAQQQRVPMDPIIFEIRRSSLQPREILAVLRKQVFTAVIMLEMS